VNNKEEAEKLQTPVEKHLLTKKSVSILHFVFVFSYILYIHWCTIESRMIQMPITRMKNHCLVHLSKQ
jgi:hypothetical protein